MMRRTAAPATATAVAALLLLLMAAAPTASAASAADAPATSSLSGAYVEIRSSWYCPTTLTVCLLTVQATHGSTLPEPGAGTLMSPLGNSACAFSIHAECITSFSVVLPRLHPCFVVDAHTIAPSGNAYDWHGIC